MNAVNMNSLDKFLDEKDWTIGIWKKSSFFLVQKPWFWSFSLVYEIHWVKINWLENYFAWKVKIWISSMNSNRLKRLKKMVSGKIWFFVVKTGYCENLLFYVWKHEYI